MTIFTIGHSTCTAEAFVALLKAHGVEQIADVRTLPRSRRHPQRHEGTKSHEARSNEEKKMLRARGLIVVAQPPKAALGGDRT